jgi:dTDP-4-dehydrorhamnose 3,5-epimerase/reductase
MSEVNPEIEFDKPLKQHETPIPGLIIFDLTVFGDNRGWFKENWQLEKMTALGLPDFGPVQNNISLNGNRGTIRGIHAEPWDKFISVGKGSFFGAWIDLREDSETYGKTFTATIDASKAVYVPAGVANSYLTLEDETVYSYLVNDHWYPDAKYTFVNATDPSLGIDWPIPITEWEMSEKDKNHPMLKEVTPVKPKKTLILGAKGQLGRALQAKFPEAEVVNRDTFDISDPSIITARHWRDYNTIINAAAYTAVDLAETPDGRRDAWLSNATALTNLVKIANANRIQLIHISSDYVFDGTEKIHTETEHLSPLGVYAQSKAAGDLVISTTPRHYIIRTSWVIGDGNNFVRTMKSLAERGIKPSVVDDQVGRLTFTEDLAQGIKHLLDVGAEYGTYNVTNDGEPASWASIAKEVYTISGKSASDVTPVSTTEYYADKDNISPRPLQSTLDLDKIKGVGFSPREWRQVLYDYVNNL